MGRPFSESFPKNFPHSWRDLPSTKTASWKPLSPSVQPDQYQRSPEVSVQLYRLANHLQVAKNEFSRNFISKPKKGTFYFYYTPRLFLPYLKKRKVECPLFQPFSWWKGYIGHFRRPTPLLLDASRQEWESVSPEPFRTLIALAR